MAEEKGYWFSTENGTHIHAEEGESKEQAMGKKFKNFGAKKEGKKSSKREQAEKWAKEHGYTGLDDPEYERAYGEFEDEEDDDNPLKAESRSMINENQANDPNTLADKLDDKEAEKTLKNFGERPEWAKKIDEEFKPKFETTKQMDSLYKQAKEKDLSFERTLLNDIKNNPDKYNEFTLGNKQYKRNGNAFDMYEDGKHVWTGTYNSVASDVNKYYEDTYAKIDKPRLGKDYDFRDREQSTKNHNEIITKINDLYGRGKISKKEYWDRIDLEVDRWNNEQNYWYEKEDNPYDKDVAEQQAKRRKEDKDLPF